MSGELLRAALSHAARGWRVFPLRLGDKRPAIRDWEARATTDPARIRRAWVRAPFGIGIACGPSGLVVLDLDRPKPDSVRPPEWGRPGISDGVDVLAALAEDHGVELPLQTYSVLTGSGGEHLYFTALKGERIRNSASRIGWLLDVRAEGGYVVAAGSTVRGRRYRASEAPVAPLPTWLTALLTEREAPDPVAGAAERALGQLGARGTGRAPRRGDFAPLLDVVGRRSAYTAAALRGELDHVLASRPGDPPTDDVQVDGPRLGATGRQARARVTLSGVAAGGCALVAGGGPIGIGLVLGLRARGVERVVVSEPSAERREVLAALGAQVVDPTTEDVLAVVDGATDGVGADAAFDAAGVAPAFDAVVACLAPGGRAVIVAAHERPVAFTPSALLRSETAVVGSLAYRPEDFDAVVAAMAEGAYRTTGWVQDRPLDDVVEALEDLRAARATKILLRIG